MKTLAIVTTGLLTGAAISFAEFATLDFESAGGYTTNVAEFTDGDTDYFTRTDGTNIGSVNYTNAGSWFAAQDIDGDQTVEPVILTWTVNITGQTGIVFGIDFAEDDDGTNEDWDSLDFVHIDYQIDGGSVTNLLWLENDGTNFNTAPQIDTDFDGDGDGATITNSFVNYTAGIAGTGSSIDIIVTIQLDSSDEDIAFDNLTLTAAVPEQGTFALLAGMFALTSVMLRRRG